MRVAIVEDERPAADNLVHCLKDIDEPIKVVEILTSIETATRWLHENQMPDLMLMDIQLSDGLSFNIFKNVAINCPVIFITAYDKYLTEAFEYNGIDYLLKPIDQTRLENTIKKYKNLQKHFLNNHTSLLEYLSQHNKKRTRIVVRKGIEFLTIRVEDIAYFFTEHKIVFLVDKDKKKYMVDKKNLTEMMDELEDQTFFRANRKYIVNADYIASFKTVDNSKILVELSVPVNEEIIVSQENAPVFKTWINES